MKEHISFIKKPGILFRILCIILIIAFFINDLAFAADEIRSCLAVPNFFNRPCSVKYDPNTRASRIDTVLADKGVPAPIFLFHLIADAQAKKLRDAVKLRNLIRVLIAERYDARKLEGYDWEHIDYVGDSYVLKVNDGRKLRFTAKPGDEKIAMKFQASTGQFIFMLEIAPEENPHTRDIGFASGEMSEVSNAIYEEDKAKTVKLVEGLRDSKNNIMSVFVDCRKDGFTDDNKPLANIRENAFRSLEKAGLYDPEITFVVNEIITEFVPNIMKHARDEAKDKENVFGAVVIQLTQKEDGDYTIEFLCQDNGGGVNLQDKEGKEGLLTRVKKCTDSDQLKIPHGRGIHITAGFIFPKFPDPALCIYSQKHKMKITDFDYDNKKVVGEVEKYPEYDTGLLTYASFTVGKELICPPWEDKNGPVDANLTDDKKPDNETGILKDVKTDENGKPGPDPGVTLRSVVDPLTVLLCIGAFANLYGTGQPGEMFAMRVFAQYFGNTIYLLGIGFSVLMIFSVLIITYEFTAHYFKNRQFRQKIRFNLPSEEIVFSLNFNNAVNILNKYKQGQWQTQNRKLKSEISVVIRICEEQAFRLYGVLKEMSSERKKSLEEKIKLLIENNEIIAELLGLILESADLYDWGSLCEQNIDEADANLAENMSGEGDIYGADLLDEIRQGTVSMLSFSEEFITRIDKTVIKEQSLSVYKGEVVKIYNALSDIQDEILYTTDIGNINELAEQLSEQLTLFKTVNRRFRDKISKPAVEASIDRFYGYVHVVPVDPSLENTTALVRDLVAAYRYQFKIPEDPDSKDLSVLGTALKTEGIDRDDYTALIYPAAGNYDDTLITSLVKEFPRLTEIHLISLSYQDKAYPELWERWRRKMIDEARKVDPTRKYKITLHPMDYFEYRVDIESMGRRIIIDKYPGFNSAMRNDNRFYPCILEDTIDGDIILTVRGGVKPYRWAKEIADGIKIEGYLKNENWIVSVRTPGDRSRIREKYQKSREDSNTFNIWEMMHPDKDMDALGRTIAPIYEETGWGVFAYINFLIKAKIGFKYWLRNLPLIAGLFLSNRFVPFAIILYSFFNFTTLNLAIIASLSILVNSAVFSFMHYNKTIGQFFIRFLAGVSFNLLNFIIPLIAPILLHGLWNKITSKYQAMIDGPGGISGSNGYERPDMRISRSLKIRSLLAEGSALRAEIMRELAGGATYTPGQMNNWTDAVISVLGIPMAEEQAKKDLRSMIEIEINFMIQQEKRARKKVEPVSGPAASLELSKNRPDQKGGYGERIAFQIAGIRAIKGEILKFLLKKLSNKEIVMPAKGDEEGFEALFSIVIDECREALVMAEHYSRHFGQSPHKLVKNILRKVVWQDKNDKPRTELANKYKITGIVSGATMGVFTLGADSILISLGISLAAFFLGWGIHELGHFLGGDFGKSNVKEMRAGPMVSALMFVVTAMSAISFLPSGALLFNIPIFSILLIFSSNFGIHMLADDMALFSTDKENVEEGKKDNAVESTGFTSFKREHELSLNFVRDIVLNLVTKREDGRSILLGSMGAEKAVMTFFRGKDVKNIRLAEKLIVENIKGKRVLVVPGYASNAFMFAELGAKEVYGIDRDMKTLAWHTAVRNYYYHRPVGYVPDITIGDMLMVHADPSDNAVSDMQKKLGIPNDHNPINFMIPRLQESVYSEAQFDPIRTVTFVPGVLGSAENMLVNMFAEPGSDFDFIYVPFLLGIDNGVVSDEDIKHAYDELWSIANEDAVIMIAPFVGTDASMHKLHQLRGADNDTLGKLEALIPKNKFEIIEETFIAKHRTKSQKKDGDFTAVFLRVINKEEAVPVHIRKSSGLSPEWWTYYLPEGIEMPAELKSKHLLNEEALQGFIALLLAESGHNAELQKLLADILSNKINGSFPVIRILLSVMYNQRYDTLIDSPVFINALKKVVKEGGKDNAKLALYILCRLPNFKDKGFIDAARTGGFSTSKPDKATALFEKGLEMEGFSTKAYDYSLMQIPFSFALTILAGSMNGLAPVLGGTIEFLPNDGRRAVEYFIDTALSDELEGSIGVVTRMQLDTTYQGVEGYIHPLLVHKAQKIMNDRLERRMHPIVEDIRTSFLSNGHQHILRPSGKEEDNLWPKDAFLFIATQNGYIPFSSRGMGVKGGEFVSGYGNDGTFMMVTEGALSHNKLRELSPNANIYNVPPGFLTLNVRGKNYLIGTSHIDVVMGAVPVQASPDTQVILIDPFYRRHMNGLDERIAGTEGVHFVDIPESERYLNPANFVILPDGKFILPYAPKTKRALTDAGVKKNHIVMLPKKVNRYLSSLHILGGSIGCLVGQDSMPQEFIMKKNKEYGKPRKINSGDNLDLILFTTGVMFEEFFKLGIPLLAWWILNAANLSSVLSYFISAGILIFAAVVFMKVHKADAIKNTGKTMSFIYNYTVPFIVAAAGLYMGFTAINIATNFVGLTIIFVIGVLAHFIADVIFDLINAGFGTKFKLALIWNHESNLPKKPQTISDIYSPEFFISNGADPNNPFEVAYVLLKIFNKHLMEGDIKQAEILHKQILAMYDNDPAIISKEGLMFEDRGLLDEAEERFRLVTRLVPYDAYSHLDLARVIYDNKDELNAQRLLEAESECRLAFNIEPDLEEGYTLLAQILVDDMQFGDVESKKDEAVAILEIALELDEYDARANILYGTMLGTNSPNKAYRHIIMALQTEPGLETPEVTLLLGRLVPYLYPEIRSIARTDDPAFDRVNFFQHIKEEAAKVVLPVLVYSFLNHLAPERNMFNLSSFITILVGSAVIFTFLHVKKGDFNKDNKIKEAAYILAAPIAVSISGIVFGLFAALNNNAIVKTYFLVLSIVFHLAVTFFVIYLRSRGYMFGFARINNHNRSQQRPYLLKNGVKITALAIMSYIVFKNTGIWPIALLLILSIGRIVFTEEIEGLTEYFSRKKVKHYLQYVARRYHLREVTLTVVFIGSVVLTLFLWARMAGKGNYKIVPEDNNIPASKKGDKRRTEPQIEKKKNISLNKIETGNDTGFIGKYAVYSYSEDADLKKIGRGHLLIDVLNIKDNKRVTLRIKANKAPKGIFRTFKRSGKYTEINKKVAGFLDNFDGAVYMLDENEYGIKGFGSKHVLAISKELAGNQVALFHEVAHGAIDSGILKAGELLEIAGGEDVLNEYLKKNDRKNPKLRTHYIIRLFQEKEWERENTVLTHAIREEDALVVNDAIDTYPYMQASLISDYGNDEIKTASEKILKGYENASDMERSERIFDWVRENIKYAFDLNWDVPASEVLELGYGHCGNISNLTMCLLRASGLPSRIGVQWIDKQFGYKDFAPTDIYQKIAGNDILGKTKHVWAEVLIDGKWYILDPLLNKEVIQRPALNRKYNETIKLFDYWINLRPSSVNDTDMRRRLTRKFYERYFNVWDGKYKTLEYVQPVFRQNIIGFFTGKKEFSIESLIRGKSLQSNRRMQKQLQAFRGDGAPKSIILYADDVLENAVIFDIEETIRKLAGENGILNGGNIILYSRSDKLTKEVANLKKLIEKASEDIGVIIVKRSEIVPDNFEGEIADEKEIRMLLRDLERSDRDNDRVRDLDKKDVLAIVRGNGIDWVSFTDNYDENIPLVILNGHKNNIKGVFSFQEAILTALEISDQDGKHGWIKMIDPIEGTEEIYLRYMLYREEILTSM